MNCSKFYVYTPVPKDLHGKSHLYETFVANNLASTIADKIYQEQNNETLHKISFIKYNHIQKRAKIIEKLTYHDETKYLVEN